MPDILFVLLGAGVGGVGTWLWVSRQMRDQLREELDESARKSARAVDWVKSEAAMQMERRDQEIATLRATLDERQHDVEKARSRLQADLTLAQRERAQFESRSAGLSQTADELRSQLQAGTAEGLQDLARLNDVADSLGRVVANFAAVIETMDTRLRAAAGQGEERDGVHRPSPGQRPGLGQTSAVPPSRIPPMRSWARNIPGGR